VRQPDLVLFDMVLRHHDGEAFVRSFKELSCGRTALIAFSAMANLEEAAARIGADGYVAKPFGIDDLLTLVAGHLDRLQPEPASSCIAP
jgi:DNA-binding response OmpR family regulator